MNYIARKRRSGLLKPLRDIVLESPSAQVLVTKGPCVGEKIRRYFSQATVASDSPNEGDISRYLETKLDRGDLGPMM